MSTLSSMKLERGKEFSYLACKSEILNSALNNYREYNKETDREDRLGSIQNYVQIFLLEAVENWHCREV